MRWFYVIFGTADQTGAGQLRAVSVAARFLLCAHLNMQPVHGLAVKPLTF